MTHHEHKTFLLGCALILGGTAFADDGHREQDAYGKQAYAQKSKAGTERFEVTPESKAELVALFQQALDSCCATGTCAEAGGCATECVACASGECTDAHKQSCAKLVWAVSSNPEALAVVRPLIESRFTGAATRDGQRDLMLWMLSSCKGEEALTCGDRLFEKSPQSFGESQLLAFAGRSKPMTKALSRLAAQGRVLPAAYFALAQEWQPSKSGKRAWGTLIEATQNKCLDARTTGEALVAGAVLKQLGEPEHLQRVLGQVRESALASLDAGKLDAALKITLNAEYTTNSQSYWTPLGLSSAAREMQNHYLKRSQEAAIADQVFELIERTLPM